VQTKFERRSRVVIPMEVGTSVPTKNVSGPGVLTPGASGAEARNDTKPGWPNCPSFVRMKSSALRATKPRKLKRALLIKFVRIRRPR
jgi:hypothetical protein